jgi:hypothetical protein
MSIRTNPESFRGKEEEEVYPQIAQIDTDWKRVAAAHSLWMHRSLILQNLCKSA